MRCFSFHRICVLFFCLIADLNSIWIPFFWDKFKICSSTSVCKIYYVYVYCICFHHFSQWTSHQAPGPVAGDTGLAFCHLHWIPFWGAPTRVLKTAWWVMVHHVVIIQDSIPVGGLVAINFIFPELLGMSSSQITNSYFSEGWLNHHPEYHSSSGPNMSWIYYVFWTVSTESFMFGTL